MTRHAHLAGHGHMMADLDAAGDPDLRNQQCVLADRVPWPMATRLSSLLPRPMAVLPKAARLIAQFEPISTSSSMTTLPICGIL